MRGQGTLLPGSVMKVKIYRAAGSAIKSLYPTIRDILVVFLTSISHGLTRVSLFQLRIGGFQTETPLVTDEGRELGRTEARSIERRFMDKTYLAGRGIEHKVDNKKGSRGTKCVTKNSAHEQKLVWS